MQPDRVVVSTGVLVGRTNGRVRSFKGVPYAEPPVGALRWRPPEPCAAWAGERAALEFGPSAYQSGPEGVADLVAIGGAPPPFSEDCLTLNVWAPSDAGPSVGGAPVLVWLHGGSGRMGAGSLPFYDGSAFAESGVLLVTLNYRLGHLGFFAHPALTEEAGSDQPLASFGIMDQLLALRWVRENIAAFGGNPDRVTLFGESMGGFHILALMACPSARELFQQAIVQSGGGWFPPNPLTTAQSRGSLLASAAGLPGARATAEQLRALAPEALMAIPGEFHPVIDGRLLPEELTVAHARGAATDIPLLIGVNSGEHSLLNYPGVFEKFRASQKPKRVTALAELYGTTADRAIRHYFRDVLFSAPARWMARLRRRQPTYLYWYGYVREANWPTSDTAAHGSEISAIFLTLDRSPDGVPSTAADEAMAQSMHARWVAFAKDGNPGSDWPPYAKERDNWMVFDSPDGTQASVLRPQLNWLDRRMGWLIVLLRTKVAIGRLARFRLKRSGAGSAS